MKPTTDIVEELRLYNRWRRGDEAITAPDPTALGKLLDDAADRIEHLFASGIHTCNADCQRPMCVLRRERDKAQNDLARVTAELEHHKSVKETIDSAHKELSREHAALRARSAELEAQIERDAWTLSPEMVQTRNDQLAAKLEQAEQRNSELEAALRGALGWLEKGGVRSAHVALAHALARAESATPAKHPDTVRLDWLEGAPSERLAEVRRILWQQRNTCEATRAAIDAARKQEASK